MRGDDTEVQESKVTAWEEMGGKAREASGVPVLRRSFAGRGGVVHWVKSGTYIRSFIVLRTDEGSLLEPWILKRLMSHSSLTFFCCC